MNKKIFLTICWGLIWLIGCSNSENNPLIAFEKGYINQQILLTAPNRFNTFATSAPIYLEITSNSDYEIVLPNDLNVRIFQRKAGDWIEILELPTTRLPAGDLVFAPNKKLRHTTTVSPALDQTQRYQLRIYVSGDMKTEEGIKQVAGYVDVTLLP